MRTITKTITLPVDSQPRTFRLMKLDAFSGAALLKLLSRHLKSLPDRMDHPVSSAPAAPGQNPATATHNSADPGRSSETAADLVPPVASAPAGENLIFSLFTSLSDTDLRTLMLSCLSHVEVLLEAGWQPIMTQGEWGWSDLSHDTATALKLTLEEALWTLQGFFGESGSPSRPAEPTAS